MNTGRKVLPVAALCFAAVLTACNPMSREAGTEAGESRGEALEALKSTPPNEVGPHITEDVSDSFGIDADIKGLEELAEYRLGAVELTRHLFTPREEVLGTLAEWLPASGTAETAERQTDEYLENGQEIVSLGMDYSDGCWMQVRDLYFVGYNPAYTEGDYTNYLELTANQEPYLSNPKLLKLERDEDLAFLTAEEARTEALDLMDALKTGADFQVEVYTASGEKLGEIAKEVEEERSELSDSQPIQIGEKDEGYELVLYQTVSEGVPVICYEPPASVCGTVCVGQNNQIRRTAEGIVSINIGNLYDVGQEKEPQELVPLGDILEAEAEHSAQTLKTGQKETVTLVRLCYLPILEDGENLSFLAKPVWCVVSRVEAADGWAEASMTVYDAATGEVIPWEG